MKKQLLCILMASALLASCHDRQNEFKTYNYDDRRAFLLTADEQLWPGGDTLGVDNSYSIQWPASGTLTPEAEAELLLRCFADSAATSFSQAADRWLSHTWLYEEGSPAIHTHPVDSLGSREMYNYAKMTGTIRRDSNLATLSLNTETFAAYAAHGLYTAEYIVMDLVTKKIVHLNDLVDTASLGEIIIRAIEDLTVNKDVNDCLFDECRAAGRVNVPRDFYIDSTRSVIYLVFQLYDIAPYACGIQTVSLPIFWLSKHTPLTPYCKELFGPGCSID